MAASGYYFFYRLNEKKNINGWVTDWKKLNQDTKKKYETIAENQKRIYPQKVKNWMENTFFGKKWLLMHPNTRFKPENIRYVSPVKVDGKFMWVCNRFKNVEKFTSDSYRESLASIISNLFKIKLQPEQIDIITKNNLPILTRDQCKHLPKLKYNLDFLIDFNKMIILLGKILQSDLVNAASLLNDVNSYNYPPYDYLVLMIQERCHLVWGKNKHGWISPNKLELPSPDHRYYPTAATARISKIFAADFNPLSTDSNSVCFLNCGIMLQYMGGSSTTKMSNATAHEKLIHEAAQITVNIMISKIIQKRDKSLLYESIWIGDYDYNTLTERMMKETKAADKSLLELFAKMQWKDINQFGKICR
eukprot:514141_1